MKRLNLKAAPPPRKRHLDRVFFEDRSYAETAIETRAFENAFKTSFARILTGGFVDVRFRNAGQIFIAAIHLDDPHYDRLVELLVLPTAGVHDVSDVVAMELQMLFNFSVEAE